jgi:hypothetical protein
MVLVFWLALVSLSIPIIAAPTNTWRVIGAVLCFLTLAVVITWEKPIEEWVRK